MKCSLAANRSISGAIRPLDVAAIVCVVAVLVFLGLFGTGRFKERALRTRCQGNLRQIGTALELLSKDNNGQLPDCSAANPRYAGPVWPWDIHTNLVSDLEAKGASRQVFYCPANQEMNDDRHWNFWRANPAPIRVIGYGMLFRGTAMVPSRLWQSKLQSQGQASPAQTELSFDATASVADDFTRIQGNFTDRSNHVRSKRPLGGNVLCTDQHVEWRDFKAMEFRFNTVGTAGLVAWSY